MMNFWPFRIEHVLVGCALVAAAYILRQKEKQRPQGLQRTWVKAFAYVLMIIGFIYGLGIGESMIWQSLTENFEK